MIKEKENENNNITCVDCKYWSEIIRKGHLKYRCINESSVFYMHDTDAAHYCAESEKMP